jgi:hypothetical protein
MKIVVRQQHCSCVMAILHYTNKLANKFYNKYVSGATDTNLLYILLAD